MDREEHTKHESVAAVTVCEGGGNASLQTSQQ